MSIKAVQDHVIVADMNFKERTTEAGILILGDDKQSTGIRPRWGRVVAIGQRQKDILIGQFVLVKHGRWTRGVEIEGETIRRVDTDDILVVSDVPQIDESLSGSEVVTDQQEKHLDDLYN